MQFRAPEGPFQLGDRLLVARVKYKLGTKHFLPQVQVELRSQKCQQLKTFVVMNFTDNPSAAGQ